jgi:hypothetical protein
MSEVERPAFYAARPGGWRDWWTILHFPYTVWHLSYVAIGACLAPEVSGRRLAGTALSFLLAVGIAAHALDEVHGHPLGTRLSDRTLWVTTVLGMGGALGIGVMGVGEIGPGLIPFMVIGPVLVFGYNAEMFGGRLHTDAGFAVSWGAFPVLTAYFAQAETIGGAAVLGAVAAFGLSYAQRTLSTPARTLRRRTRHVAGSVTLADGTVVPLDSSILRAPLERALLAMSWSMAALATALVVARLG